MGIEYRASTLSPLNLYISLNFRHRTEFMPRTKFLNVFLSMKKMKFDMSFLDGIKHICKKNIFLILFNYQKGNLNIIKFSSNWIWAWKVTQTSLFVQQLLLFEGWKHLSNTISSFKLSFSFVHDSFFVFNAL